MTIADTLNTGATYAVAPHCPSWCTLPRDHGLDEWPAAGRWHEGPRFGPFVVRSFDGTGETVGMQVEIDEGTVEIGGASQLTNHAAHRCRRGRMDGRNDLIRPRQLTRTGMNESARRSVRVGGRRR